MKITRQIALIDTTAFHRILYSKILVALAVVAFSLPAQSQNRYTQKLYAYREIIDRTNIFINDTTRSDTAVHPNYLLYVELAKQQKPIWNTAIIDANIYTVHPTLVENLPLIIGERKSGKGLVRLTPLPTNNLWKLEFDLNEQGSAASNPEPKVVLKGTFKGKKIVSTITRFINLETQK